MTLFTTSASGCFHDLTRVIVPWKSANGQGGNAVKGNAVNEGKTS